MPPSAAKPNKAKWLSNHRRAVANLLSKREGVVCLNRHSQHILVSIDHRVWDGGQSGVVQSQAGSCNALDSQLYSRFQVCICDVQHLRIKDCSSIVHLQRQQCPSNPARSARQPALAVTTCVHHVTPNRSIIIRKSQYKVPILCSSRHHRSPQRILLRDPSTLAKHRDAIAQGYMDSPLHYHPR